MRNFGLEFVVLDLVFMVVIIVFGKCNVEMLCDSTCSKLKVQ